MTSMVLTLDIIKLLGDAFNIHYSAWSLENLSEFLTAMQSCFVYGRCFNANMPLRNELKSRNFMRFRDSPARLPHLFEQVIQSCTQIMISSFRLFKEETSGRCPKSLLVEPIIQR